MLFNDTDRLVSGEISPVVGEKYIDVDKIASENPQLYEYVKSLLPTSCKDLPHTAALITETVVDIVEAKVGNGIALSLGERILKVTCLAVATVPIEIAIDLTLKNEDGEISKDEVAKAITMAMVDFGSTILIGEGLAAIGITGASGILLGVALGAGVGVAASRGYDIWIDPDTIFNQNKEDSRAEITTVLTFSDYFDYHWDRLNEWDNWTLGSDTSDLKIEFRKDENKFLFSEPKVDEETFYKLLEKHGGDFNVVWGDGSGDSFSDKVVNLYHKSKEALISLDTQPAALAKLNLRPFFLLEEQRGVYESINIDEFSELFWEDRSKFLYSLNCHQQDPQSVPPSDNGPIGFGDLSSTKSAWLGHRDIPLGYARYAFGTEGDETIEGSSGYYGDHLYGMGGNDKLVGKSGDDYLEGGKGQDELDGGADDDTFCVIGEDSDYDIFNGGDGYDKIIGGAGDDTIRVHEFNSDNSIQEIDGLSGNNIVAGTALRDELDFSETQLKNIDFIDAGAGHDQIVGSIADDIIKGGADHDELEGGSGNDTLYGNEGIDSLYGGEENDTLYGASTENDDDGILDILDGGTGHDIYYAGEGDLIQDADHNGIIYYRGHNIADLEYVHLHDNVYEVKLPGDDGDTGMTVSYDKEAEELVGSYHFLSIKNFRNGDYGVNLPEDSEEGYFQKGTTGSDMLGIYHYMDSDLCGVSVNFEYMGYRPNFDTLSMYGFDGTDHLLGLSGEDGDFLDGGDDDDWIAGRDGADLIYAGDGDDYVTSVFGEATIHAGSGNDIILGNWTDYLFALRDGWGINNDWIPRHDVLNDFFNGFDPIYNNEIKIDENGLLSPIWESLNYNSFSGESGYDNRFNGDGPTGIPWTYSFALSAMNEPIEDWNHIGYFENVDDIREDAGKYDLNFKAINMTYSHEVYGVSDISEDYGIAQLDPLIYSFPELCYVTGHVSHQNPLYIYGDQGDDLLAGNDGNDSIYGGEDDDTIFGHAGDDIILGETGKDIIAGGLGNDTIFGGDEKDIIYGEGDNDLLSGGEGDDELDGGEGDDHLSGGTGADILLGGSGDDTLLGGDGNDVLIAGTGTDFMDGGAGDDTYYYALGDGIKHLEDSSGNNRLVLQGGIDPSDIKLSLGSLQISTGLAGDELHLDGVAAHDLAGTSPIQEIEFSDGQVLSISELIDTLGIDISATDEADELTGTSSRDNINALGGDDVVDGRGGADEITLETGNDFASGGDGDDFIRGDEGDDTIYGDAGNDQLYGGIGTDTLYGGSGDDLLDGGTDEDNYHFGLGGGQDIIHDAGGIDALVLADGITFDDVWIVREGNDLSVTLADGSRILIPDWTLGENLIENIRFGDGTEQSLESTLVLRARSYELSMVEDTSLSGSIDLGNPGEGVAFVVGQQGNNGTLEVQQDGSWIYQPVENYYGQDRVEITVTNAAGESAVSVLEFNIDPVNDAPLVSGAVPLGEIPKDGSVLITAGQLRANATDIDGDNLEVVGLSANTGSLIDNGDGTWTYQPAADYSGIVDFSYSVTDGEFMTSATANLTVNSANNAPIVSGPVALGEITEDGSLLITVGELLSNAFDIDGDNLSVVDLQTDNGSLVDNGDGSWTYQPLADYNGPVEFSYTVTDGDLVVDAAAGLTVTPVNDAPVVSGAVALGEVLEDGSMVISAEQLLANATDIDGDNLYISDLSANVGILSDNGDGSWTYQPELDFNGPVEFSYTVTDGELMAAGTAELIVTPVNDVPVAPASELYQLLGTLTQEGALAASDVDGDLLSFAVTTLPQHGALSVDEEGRWVYSAEDGYCGSDRAVITVDDGNGGTAATLLDFSVNVYSGGDLVIDGAGPAGLLLDNATGGDLQLQRQGDDLQIAIADQGSVTLKEYFASPENGIDWLQTNDGILRLDKDAIQESSDGWLPVESFSGNDADNDLLAGSWRLDIMTGRGGDDVLFGGGGTDTLNGNDGDDTLVGEDGHDLLFGGAGADVLFGGNDWDALFGGEGDDLLIGGSGNDAVSGDGGQDSLWGGEGSDLLTGGSGDDTYHFNLGDGSDIIFDVSGNDSIIFGNEVTPAGLALFKRGTTLQVGYGIDDQITLFAYSDSEIGNRIETFTLADGSYLTDADVNQLIQQMAAFAVDEGIAMNSVDDVRKNQELMTLVAGAWHQ